MLLEPKGPNDTVTDVDNHQYSMLAKLRQYSGQQNFAIIMPSNFEDKYVKKYINTELQYMKNKTMSKRSGAAGGVFQYGTECASFTKIVRQPTTLYRSTSTNGVGMQAVYISKTGKVKTCNHGYNHIHMKRNSKDAKRADAKKSPSLSHILHHEGLNYIIGLACMKTAGIFFRTKNNGSLSHLKKSIEKHVDDPSIDILVDWMLNTGDMTNYQAIACHCDGNKSHPVEIYTLFSRSYKKEHDGFIYLPLDNCTLKVCANKQTMICNLSHTPHVPDKSRDSLNFSKVHGPRF